MNLVPEVARLIPNEVLPKLSPKVQEFVQGISRSYEMWAQFQPSALVTVIPSHFSEIMQRPLYLICDNGNGKKIAVNVDYRCLDPSGDWKMAQIVFGRLMELAKNPRVLKVVNSEEKESMLKAGEVQWEASIDPSGDCLGLQVLQSGEPIKWHTDWLLSYFNNPGISNTPLLVELDTGEVISLGLSGGGLVQTGVDPRYGPIYGPSSDWRAQAMTFASQARTILAHPRVVKMYFSPDPTVKVKGMTPNELLQYLNSLPRPITMQQPAVPQPPQIQDVAQADVVASVQPSTGSSEGGYPRGAIPSGTFIASDWAWCITRFPNAPARQQQCLADLQKKSEPDQEVQTPVIVSAGASVGTLAVLLFAAWIAYLLLKGR